MIHVPSPPSHVAAAGFPPKVIPSIRYPVPPQLRYSLVDAKSSAELCEALIHIVLGWFSFYQAGYLHRDISIRNVFL
ncbi:hypothetical protein NLJ89_g9423 [Agrocybe chaxingu]|uniref:Fungal-type protein kinase domain-containing protein n=1 Tax=Agrocybe chaxingu TaxID=84603 RepID=A0A9W8JTE2_9AGAR|nr:hypothetical protein NLJ89_g9423 [Agrocybe chaxingu]